MDRVMNGVEIILFRKLGKLELACRCTVFSINTHFKVLLAAVGQHFAEQFGKFCGVLSLFQAGLVPIIADLGITLPVGNAGHGQIHADLRAFALEV